MAGKQPLPRARRRKPMTEVDFSYAFATPHRVTVGRPDDSVRTLVDLQPDCLRLAWSNDDLRGYPLAAFKTPPTTWDIRLTPRLDGAAFRHSIWRRPEGWLPGVLNLYRSGQVEASLEVLGGAPGAIVRVRAHNDDTVPHTVALDCQSHAWGESPAWVSPGEVPADHLVAGWAERADRVLLFGVGAGAWSTREDGGAPGPKLLQFVWQLAPGEKREGFLIRPARAYTADLPRLRRRDWSREFERAAAQWRALLDRTFTIVIPDPRVALAWKACLADLFIMREPVADGYIAAVPGTECYRAPNAFEAAIVAVALDQADLPKLAADGYRMCLQMQEPDGNWNDPRGWGHLMWGGSGFKSWAAMEHYRLTGDKAFLAEVFPRMAASAHWNDRQRRRSRVAVNGERPLTYGLLPRGMGDCGLLDDGDLYGVFLPHNIWAVYADRLALEAAESLGEEAEARRLRRIHRRGRAALLAALERGAIAEKGYRWIPGVPGKTSGSRWGALNALFPTGLLPADHELIEGTLHKIESRLSPGGIPINTGWLPEGMWVAITLDNIAAAHLARGDGDAAAAYLYATLNHGTPLFTWCEERGPQAGTEQCTGDRQHLWTPVAVVRCLRDCLVREHGDTLQLGLGLPRHWIASGETVGLSEAPTHFGKVSYGLCYHRETRLLEGAVAFPRRGAPLVDLYLRLPEGLQAAALTCDCEAELLPEEGLLRFRAPRGKASFTVSVRPTSTDGEV